MPKPEKDYYKEAVTEVGWKNARDRQRREAARNGLNKRVKELAGNIRGFTRTAELHREYIKIPKDAPIDIGRPDMQALTPVVQAFLNLESEPDQKAVLAVTSESHLYINRLKVSVLRGGEIRRSITTETKTPVIGEPEISVNFSVSDAAGLSETVTDAKKTSEEQFISAEPLIALGNRVHVGMQLMEFVRAQAARKAREAVAAD